MNPGLRFRADSRGAGDQRNFDDTFWRKYMQSVQTESLKVFLEELDVDMPLRKTEDISWLLFQIQTDRLIEITKRLANRQPR